MGCGPSYASLPLRVTLHIFLISSIWIFRTNVQLQVVLRSHIGISFWTLSKHARTDLEKCYEFNIKLITRISIRTWLSTLLNHRLVKFWHQILDRAHIFIVLSKPIFITIRTWKLGSSRRGDGIALASCGVNPRNSTPTSMSGGRNLEWLQNMTLLGS